MKVLLVNGGPHKNGCIRVINGAMIQDIKTN